MFMLCYIVYYIISYQVANSNLGGLGPDKYRAPINIMNPEAAPDKHNCHYVYNKYYDYYYC